MDINQALGIAKNLKNHFRAFEMLDEFIKEIAVRQNLINEFENRKATIEKEILILKEEKIKVAKDTSIFKKQKNKEMDEIIKNLSARLDKHSADIEKEIAELEAKKNEAYIMMRETEIKMKKMEELHAKNIERIKLETEEAEKTLSDIRTKLNAIKEKF